MRLLLASDPLQNFSPRELGPSSVARAVFYKRFRKRIKARKLSRHKIIAHRITDRRHRLRTFSNLLLRGHMAHSATQLDEYYKNLHEEDLALTQQNVNDYTATSAYKLSFRQLRRNLQPETFQTPSPTNKMVLF
jgi:hypothetical protein